MRCTSTSTMPPLSRARKFHLGSFFDYNAEGKVVGIEMLPASLQARRR